MHGIIFAELKKYVVARLGGESWNKLLAAAGQENAMYLPTQIYKDENLVALVSTASKITGKPVPAILEDFGEFVAPDLLSMYKGQINPSWKTLDLLEHTEETIHRVVRLKDPQASPPKLVARRTGPGKVIIEYTSARKLCGVARGIARGVAKHYGERVAVKDEACMLNGDPKCLISVEQIK